MKPRTTSLKRLEQLKLNKATPKLLLIAALALLALSQVISFAQDGKLFGITIREDKKSVGLKGAPTSPKDESANSKVCDTLDKEFVSELVGKEVLPSTISADITKPNLSSSCIFKTDLKSGTKDLRVVAVSLQENTDEKSAQAELDRVASKNGDTNEEVFDFGDKSYYNPKLNQLITKKGNKIINVFINSGGDKDLDKKEVAKKITEKLF